MTSALTGCTSLREELKDITITIRGTLGHSLAERIEALGDLLFLLQREPGLISRIREANLAGSGDSLEAATRFLRAHKGTELTRNHGAHGDTEYQYEIESRGQDWSNPFVRIYKRCGDSPDSVHWPLVCADWFNDVVKKYGTFEEESAS